jgi:hypothetical protein
MEHSRLVALLSLLAVLICASTSFAQIRVEVTEVPYLEPHSFMGLALDFAGTQNVERADGSQSNKENQVGLTLRAQGAKRINIQAELELGYRRIDFNEFKDPALPNISLWTLLIGGRYFPLYPTFLLSQDIAVRLNASFAAGWTGCISAEDLGGLDGRIALGFAFTGAKDPSGLTAEVVYRPFGFSGTTYNVKPSWCLRLGFLWGPGTEPGY